MLARSLVTVACSLAVSALEAQSTSRLWGRAGELWDPRGRLPDFSHAGYHGGDRQLPTVPVVANVKTFGAVGNGTTDDTAAFRAAIARTSGGALLIPRGRYRLTGDLIVRTSNLVLRGEGSGDGDTVLAFEKPLAALYGPSPAHAWNGGLLRFSPRSSPRRLARVVAPAVRGDATLTVDTAAGVRAGDMIVLHLRDDAARSLGRHLHNDQANPGVCSYQQPIVLDWPVRVRAVVGKRVELAQPLRLDVRAAWSPEVRSAPFLTEVGVEHLRIRFPPTRYVGHNRGEPGYNGVYFAGGVANAWVRDVAIEETDCGVVVGRLSKWIEARDVRLLGRIGHHGLRCEFAADCLFADFDVRCDRIHAISLDHRTNGCVFQRGRGAFRLELDHHRDSPFENLLVDFRSPTSFDSSGSWCAGPHSGARGTFWNLHGTTGLPLLWGHIQTNVVGRFFGFQARTADRAWYERATVVQPPDLHAAQLAFRRARDRQPTRFASTALGDRRGYRERDRTRWAVVDDRGDRRYALTLQGQPPLAGGRLTEHSVTAGAVFLGFDVSLRARSIADPRTAPATDYAVVFGFADDESYDFASFGATTSNTGIFRVRGGVATRLAAATTAALTDSAWHTVRVRRGPRGTVRAWLDGRLLVTAPNVAPRTGSLGVGSRGDAAMFDDVQVLASLSADRATVSAPTGGAQRLTLQAPRRALASYVIGGTLSGTEPGLWLGAVRVPLNPDPYLLFSLADPTLLIANGAGRLDASGRATATLRLPPLDPRAIGRTLHHAFVTLRGPAVDFASNAVGLRLTR